jgi:hypothetical protein
VVVRQPENVLDGINFQKQITKLKKVPGKQNKQPITRLLKVVSEAQAFYMAQQNASETLNVQNIL